MAREIERERERERERARARARERERELRPMKGTRATHVYVPMHVCMHVCVYIEKDIHTQSSIRTENSVIYARVCTYVDSVGFVEAGLG